MSVTPNDIVFYGSANMPEDVASTALTGGAVDFTKRVVFYDLTATGTINAVSSSSSDTNTRVQIMVRDATGAVQTPAFITLTGQNPFLSIGSVNAAHFLAAVTTGGSIAGLANPLGTAAVGDVAVYGNTAVLAARTARTGSANTVTTTPPLFALQTGDGASVAIGMIIRITSGVANNQLRQIVAVTGYGADVVAVSRDWGANIPASGDTYTVVQGMLFESDAGRQVRAITRMFATSAADVAGTGSQRIYYEKVFAVNNNIATALTSASIQIASDSPPLPISTAVALDIGLTTALNDTATIANRLTAPAGISFTAQPAPINVPVPGNLPSGATPPNTAGAQGIWVRLTLPAGSASYTGAANFRVQGTTT